MTILKKSPYRAVLLTKAIITADSQRELFRMVTESIERTEEAAQEHGWAETLIWESPCEKALVLTLPDFTLEPAEYQ